MLYIFDWDGTLIDSTEKIVACMQSAIDDVDLPQLDKAQIKNIIGLGLPEAVRQLYPHTELAVWINCERGTPSTLSLQIESLAIFIPVFSLSWITCARRGTYLRWRRVKVGKA